MVRLLQVYSNPSNIGFSAEELVARSRRSSRPETARGAVGSARQLRDAELELLVSRYLEIRNMRQVARELRVSRTTVAKLLAERGIDTSLSMKSWEIDRAVELYEKGRSSAAIGTELGFDNHTVLNALRARGVQIIHGRSAGRRGAQRGGTGVVDKCATDYFCDCLPVLDCAHLSRLPNCIWDTDSSERSRGHSGLLYCAPCRDSFVVLDVLHERLFDRFTDDSKRCDVHRNHAGIVGER